MIIDFRQFAGAPVHQFHPAALLFLLLRPTFVIIMIEFKKGGQRRRTMVFMPDLCGDLEPDAGQLHSVILVLQQKNESCSDYIT